MGLIPKEHKEKFKDDIGGGTSYYFNAREIDEENGTRVRCVPWVFKNKRISALAFYEGWEHIPAKGKEKEHSRPVRFEIGEEIPDTIQWAMTDGRFGAPKPQVPKPCVAFLAWFPKDKAIKLCSFTQSGIVNPILEITDDDNPESNLYVSPDLSVTDLVLTKKEEGGKIKKVTYGCVAKSTTDPKTPKEALEALENFGGFSFEAFMKSEDGFNEEVALKFNQVKPIAYEGQAPKAAQPKAQGGNPAANNSIGEDKLNKWREVKTPKGAELGSLSLPQLEELKVAIEDKKKTDVPLYQYVAYAIEHFEDNEIAMNVDLGNDDIPF